MAVQDSDTSDFSGTISPSPTASSADGDTSDFTGSVSGTPSTVSQGKVDGIVHNLAAGLVSGASSWADIARDPFGYLIGKPLADTGIAAYQAIAPRFGYQKLTPEFISDALDNSDFEVGPKIADAAARTIGMAEPSKVEATTGLQRYAHAIGQGFGSFGPIGAVLGVANQGIEDLPIDRAYKPFSQDVTGILGGGAVSHGWSKARQAVAPNLKARAADATLSTASDPIAAREALSNPPEPTLANAPDTIGSMTNDRGLKGLDEKLQTSDKAAYQDQVLDARNTAQTEGFKSVLPSVGSDENTALANPADAARHVLNQLRLVEDDTGRGVSGAQSRMAETEAPIPQSVASDQTGAAMRGEITRHDQPGVDALTQSADAAQQASAAAADAAGTQRTTAPGGPSVEQQVGEAQRGVLATGEAGSKAEVTARYDRMRAAAHDLFVDAAPVKAAADEVAAEVNPKKNTSLSPLVSDAVNAIKLWDPVEPLDHGLGLLQSLGEDIGKAKTQGDNNSVRLLTKMRSAVSDTLGDALTRKISADREAVANGTMRIEDTFEGQTSPRSDVQATRDDSAVGQRSASSVADGQPDTGPRQGAEPQARGVGGEAAATGNSGTELPGSGRPTPVAGVALGAGDGKAGGTGTAPQGVSQFVDNYIAGGARDPQSEQFYVNNAKAIEAELQRRAQGDVPPNEQPGVSRDNFEPAPDDVRSLNDQARAARSQHGDTFEEGAVGTVLAENKYGRDKLDASRVPGALIASPEAAKQFLDAAGDTPANRRLLGDSFALDAFSQRGMITDGVVDPVKLKAWLTRNENTLNSYPDIRDRFSTVADAAQQVRDVQARRDQLTQDLADKIGTGSDARFAEKAFSAGSGGAENLRQYVRDTNASPEALDRLTDQIATSYRKAVERDGDIKPGLAANWQRQYASALNELRKVSPERAAMFDDAVSARTALDQQRQRQADAIKAFQDSSMGIWLDGKRGGDATPDVAMNRVFKEPNSPRVIKDLMTKMQAAGDEAASQGVARAVMNHIFGESFSNMEKGEKPAIKADVFQNALRENRSALEAALPAESMAMLDRIAQSLKEGQRVTSGNGAIVGSNSVDKYVAYWKGKDAANKPSTVLNLISGGLQIAGVGAGYMMGGKGGAVAGGYGGKKAGEALKYVVKGVAEKRNQQVADYIKQAVLDPRGFGRELMNFATPATAPTRIEQLGRAYLRSVVVANGQQKGSRDDAPQMQQQRSDATNPKMGALAEIRDYIARQRAQSVAMGLLDPNTGFPTPAGMRAAGQAYAGGVGTDAGGMVGGIKAYHGSPHSFSKFDNAAIGTGEGAQAYGHGLYFAENEGVARGYRDALSQTTVAHKGLSPEAQRWVKEVQSDVPGATVDDIREYAKGLHDPYDTESPGNAIADEIHRALSENRLSTTPGGHMYEVDLNAHPDHFLDWDKPLSQQSPHVQDALGKLPSYSVADSPTATGSLLYRSLGGSDANQAATASLQQAGIPGIRYLDGGSRGTGEGTSNYVSFDPSIIAIMRKYGLIGTTGAAAAAAGNKLAPNDNRQK